MGKIGRCLFVVWIFIAPQLLGGAIYYVATSGNDSYNGLYPSYMGGANGPLRTLSRAAVLVKPGDRVEVRGGSYLGYSKWTTDGTQAAPITITNYSGEKPAIDGNNFAIPGSDYSTLLEVTGDWYKISNLDIHHSTWYGLMVSGEHCTIDNIYAYQNWGAGIHLLGSYGVVQNCRAWNNSLQNEYFQPHSPGTWSSGIAVCRTPSYCTVRNCVAWDNWGQGINVYEAYHITVEDCISYNNQQNFYISDIKYVLFQRNLAYCTPGNMIQAYVTQNNILMGDEKLFNSSDNTVINNLCLGGERNISIGRNVFENGLVANNTFVNASPTAGSETANIRIGAGAYTNARFLNNIIIQEDGAEICELDATGVTFGYNNWSRTPRSTSLGVGDVIGNPQLARTGPTGAGALTPGWFKILDNSPAKDRAISLKEVVEDFFRTARGSAPDIGAHELAYGTSSLTASSTGTPTSGRAPLTVNFTGSASGGTTPYSYKWAFGDGATATAQSPSHSYATAGSYAAILTVTDGASATATSTVNISVTAAGTALSANIAASPTSGPAPLAVSFTGSASGGSTPYSFKWTFGDGGSSTAQNPSHTYSAAGSYSAALTVTDSTVAASSKTVTISVSAGTIALAASASASPSSGVAPLAVSLTGGATGGTPPYSFSWAFGDGGTAAIQSPSHTYSAPGSYTATLTVRDSTSAKAAATAAVTVGSASSVASLSLTAVTGAPAPGQGGTTDPYPGNHSYSTGSTVAVKSIPNTDYRFSKWDGDIPPASTFNSATTLTMDFNKSISATFCTKCADVNGDLKITPADAQWAFDIYLGKIANPTWCELENADVKCDGTKLQPKVTPSDAQWIMNKYLKKGEVSSDCSGNSRSGTLSALDESPDAARPVMTLSNATLTSTGDVLIPVIIDSSSEMDSFGFDLAFPQGVLQFVRVETAELTRDYDQLSANVMPYEPEIYGEPGSAPTDLLVLRVGGYKTGTTRNPSSGVLVTLVFRGTGRSVDTSALSVIAGYDGLQDASVLNNRLLSRQDRPPFREPRKQPRSDKRERPGD